LASACMKPNATTTAVPSPPIIRKARMRIELSPVLQNRRGDSRAACLFLSRAAEFAPACPSLLKLRRVYTQVNKLARAFRHAAGPLASPIQHA
jgi:hypothetical protein